MDRRLTVSRRPKSSSAIFFAEDPSTMILFPENSFERILIGECDRTTIERSTSTPSRCVSSLAFSSSVHPIASAHNHNSNIIDSKDRCRVHITCIALELLSGERRELDIETTTVAAGNVSPR